MKTIIKIFPYLLCLISFFSYSQDLAVLTGTSITITNGTIFSVNGLALTPSADLTLAGPNGLLRTPTAVGASIDRVFNFDNPISFQGNLAFYYEDTELNGVPEANLRLQSNDGTSWSGELTTTVSSGLNILTHTYGTATNLASVTATSSGVALSISKFNELKINLFPNPVISSFQISTELTIETLVYNNLGQVVFTSNQKNIDVSQLSAGTYIIIVKDIDSNNYNTYQIIKL